VEILKKRGVFFIGPESGHLACGDNGKGRMSEPETILQAIDKLMMNC
jgi:phosphopantothenoylcysteine decarboxylase/phosphopantothenate--cysteine ligase